MSTKPAKHDLTIYQGQTFICHLLWKDGQGIPINLTGYSARSEWRRSSRSQDILYSLSSKEDNGIQVDGDSGRILLTIPADVSSGFKFRNAVYDLELINPSGEVTRLIEGEVIVSPEVTRNE